MLRIALPADGEFNMAEDARLLLEADRGVAGCRLYTWDGAWVSLGFSQSPEKDLLPDAPVRTVPRPTGGRAVLHGHDLTVGLAVPLALLKLAGTRSVKSAYRAIAEPLVQALIDAGVNAALGENSRFVNPDLARSSDCFAHVSPNDIVNAQTGMKVCGCALRLTERAVLVQACIPISKPLVDPQKVFRTPASATWSEVDLDAFASSLSTWFDGVSVPISSYAASPIHTSG